MYKIERKLSRRKARGRRQMVKMDNNEKAVQPTQIVKAWLEHGCRVFGGESIEGQNSEEKKIKIIVTTDAKVNMQRRGLLQLQMRTGKR